MSQPKEALVIVIAIITFALISSTINTLTGNVTTNPGEMRDISAIESKESSITISQNAISNGQQLTITVNPGPEGIDDIIEIWKDKGPRKTIINFGKSVNEGDENRCIKSCTKKTSKTIIIRSYAKGLYYVKGKTVEYDEYGNRRPAEARAYFTVQ